MPKAIIVEGNILGIGQDEASAFKDARTSGLGTSDRYASAQPTCVEATQQALEAVEKNGGWSNVTELRDNIVTTRVPNCGDRTEDQPRSPNHSCRRRATRVSRLGAVYVCDTDHPALGLQGVEELPNAATTRAEAKEFARLKGMAPPPAKPKGAAEGAVQAVVIARSSLEELGARVGLDGAGKPLDVPKPSRMREREYAARMGRLADLAESENEPTLALLFQVLREEPVGCASDWAPRMAKLAGRQHPDTRAPSLCRIAGATLLATKHDEERVGGPAGEKPVELAAAEEVTGPVASLEGQRFKCMGAEVTIGLRRYPTSQRVAILLLDAGQNYAVLTADPIPSPALADDELYVATTNEHEQVARAALRSGLFEDTGRLVPDGYTQAAVWRIRTRSEWTPPAGDTLAGAVIGGGEGEPWARRLQPGPDGACETCPDPSCANYELCAAKVRS